VPAGVSVDIPVHVLCLSSGAPAADKATADGVLTANHPSVVINVGANASVRVLQQFMGAGAYWTNGLTRIQLDEHALIEHSYMQEQSAAAVHLESVTVEVAAGARYENRLMHSGARIARANLIINLNGAGAHSELRGLSLATNNQLCDVHSSTVHVRLLSQSMRTLPLPSVRLSPSCSRGLTPCAVGARGLRRYRPTARVTRSSVTRSLATAASSSAAECGCHVARITRARRSSADRSCCRTRRV